MTVEQHLVRRLRIFLLILVTSAVLLLPCLLLSEAFFKYDKLYRSTREYNGSSLSSDYRRAALRLEEPGSFECHTSKHVRASPYGTSSKRDLVLVAMESILLSQRERELQSGFTSDNIFPWVESLELSILSRAAELKHRYGYGLDPLLRLDRQKIVPYCEQQDIRRARGEPLLPPLKIHGEIRSLLLHEADRMDEAVRNYASVRPWLLIFFCTWIAYSLLGIACAFYVIRLSKAVREAARAARERNDVPPW